MLIKMNGLLKQISEYLDRFGWKKIADDEYIVEVKPAFSARSLFMDEGKKSIIRTTINVAETLDDYDLVNVLTKSGEDYVAMFNAIIDHDKDKFSCLLILSFDGGFSYPFEKLNTYFLAGLYEFVQQNKKLGIELLKQYIRKDEVIFSQGSYYDELPTLVRAQSNTKAHKLSRIRGASITFHDESGYYELESQIFGKTGDNVFLPLGSYFLGNQLIMLIPQYNKTQGDTVHPFVGIKILHVRRLQRHMRELIRMVKKQVKNGVIEPHILKWRTYKLEDLAGDQVSFIRFYWQFRDFINDLPHASKGQLTKKIKEKISRISPLLDDVIGCIDYSNCLVDYYTKRKACYEETKDFNRRKLKELTTESPAKRLP